MEVIWWRCYNVKCMEYYKQFVIDRYDYWKKYYPGQTPRCKVCGETLIGHYGSPA